MYTSMYGNSGPASARGEAQQEGQHSPYDLRNLKDASAPQTHNGSSKSTEMPWSLQDWSFDPYKLVATPASSKQSQFRTEARAISLASSAMQAMRGQAVSEPQQEVTVTRVPSIKIKGPPTCQVEGCCADLSELKEYHQRYKICEYHLKVNSIRRGGIRQRFCQQCGRFHELTEFDGDKRSCRARLQRHNARRRRKADPDTAAKSAKTSQATPQKESRDASSALDTRDNPQAAGVQATPHHPYPQDTSSSNNQKGQDWAQSSSVVQEMSLDTAMQELLPEDAARVRTGPVFFDAIQELIGDNGEAKVVKGEMTDLAERLGFHSVYPPSSLADSRNLSLQHESFSQPLPEHCMPDTSMLQANSALPAHLSFPSGSLVQPPHPNLHPHHAHPQPQQQDYFLQQMLRQGPYASTQQQQQQQQQHPNAYSVSDIDLTALVDMDHAEFAALSASMHPYAHQPAMPNFDALGPSGLSVLKEAHSLLAFGANHAQHYAPTEQLTRLSAKMYNCTPAQLPPELKKDMVNIIGCGVNSLEAYLRPGCVHLTLDAQLASADSSAMQSMGVRKAVEQVMAGQEAHFWSSDTLLIQLHDEVALVKNGKVLHVLSGSGSMGVFPSIETISPVCLLASAPALATLTGLNINGPDNTVLCRCQGAYTEVTKVPGPEGSDRLQVQLPRGHRQGAVQVEVTGSGFISLAKPLLVLDNAEAVEEVCCLERDLRGADMEGVLNDMGRVLEFLNTVRITEAGGDEPVREYSAEDVALVGHTARKLLALAVARGWPAVAELLLPPACADCDTVEAAMQAADALCPRSMSLLHLAVCSRSPELVERLVERSRAAGYQWRADVAAAQGITPLHLAALLDDGGDMVDALTDVCPEALDAWEAAPAKDGRTPAECAHAMGHAEWDILVQDKRASALAAELSSFEDLDDYQLADEPAGDDAVNGALKRASAELEASKELACEAALPLKGGAGQEGWQAVETNAGQVTSPGEDPQRSAASSNEPDDANSDPPTRLGNANPSNGKTGMQYCGAGDKLQAPAGGKHGGKEAYGMGMRSHAEQFTGKDGPTVFDRTSAVLSSLLIIAIGGGTLYLRYHIDLFAD